MSVEENINSAELVEEQTAEDINILKKIRIEKFEELKAAGKNPYEITKFDVTSLNKDIIANYEKREAEIIAAANGDEEVIKAELEKIKEENITLAGRIMSWRDMGKANFIDVRDSSNRMQVYVRMNDIGEEQFAEFKKWDIGDIVGVEKGGEIIPKITEVAVSNGGEKVIYPAKCPECGGDLVIRKGRFGEFVACSNYPGCKQVKADENKINEETGETCPQCGSPMIYKMGRFGRFEACSNYPKCKYIKPQKLEETGETCPNCGSPVVWKKGRFGPFKACSNYPKCKTIIKEKKKKEE